jgi:hypothetical protein
MNRAPFIVLPACLLLGWTASPKPPALAASQEWREQQSRPVFFSDVLNLPARIDEPKLQVIDGLPVLNCAVANRSSEQLLGLRLILLAVEPSGKLRNRIAWNEPAAISSYSIKSFEFHPTIKGELSKTDRLFLAIDEVIGRETIWRVVEGDKALRAYARGLPGIDPVVRTVANKFDPRHDAIFPVIIRR